MERQIARFRRQVESHFGGRPGRGSRYPEPLRALAVEVALERLAKGGRLGSVADDLGVGVGTLRRWVEAVPRRGGSLRAVEVVEDKPSATEEHFSTGMLVLVTAAGHRVEGLNLGEVALLLEALA